MANNEPAAVGRLHQRLTATALLLEREGFTAAEIGTAFTCFGLGISVKAEGAMTTARFCEATAMRLAGSEGAELESASRTAEVIHRDGGVVH